MRKIRIQNKKQVRVDKTSSLFRKIKRKKEKYDSLVCALHLEDNDESEPHPFSGKHPDKHR